MSEQQQRDLKHEWEATMSELTPDPKEVNKLHSEIMEQTGEAPDISQMLDISLIHEYIRLSKQANQKRKIERLQ